MPTLADLIVRNYKADPQKIAVIIQRAGYEDQSISSQQLFAGCQRYIGAYVEQSIVPGEVIVLILPHGEDLIYSFWAAILFGAVPAIMPFLSEKLSPERYRADLAALISITRPAAIVTSPDFEREVRDALLPGDSVRAVIDTQTIPPAGDSAPARFPGQSRSPEDIAILQHSSGTTGLQKGVALSHRAILNQLEAYAQVLNLTGTDVIVSWLPLYHDMGLIACFLFPILSGIPLVLMSPFDWVRAPQRLMLAVSRYHGTLSWLPNFAYNFCAQKIRDRDLQGVDLSSWRMITNCSEPVQWESHRAFLERFSGHGLAADALKCSYAMAENVFAVTQTEAGSAPVTDLLDREAYLSSRLARPPISGRTGIRLMSSGKALANTEIRILDENGQLQPDRVIGEIALKSNCMLSQYYNRPDATEKAFKDGWYLTGDFGYTLGGEVFVTGRKKDIIIVGGRNIYPQDLENLAYEVPGIHAGRAVAFGVYDEKTGTEEVAIVAEVDQQDADQRENIADALRRHITQNSAVALRHAHIVNPRWIIKTSSGKTSRSANREKYLKEIREDIS